MKIRKNLKYVVCFISYQWHGAVVDVPSLVFGVLVVAGVTPARRARHPYLLGKGHPSAVRPTSLGKAYKQSPTKVYLYGITAISSVENVSRQASVFFQKQTTRRCLTGDSLNTNVRISRVCPLLLPPLSDWRIFRVAFALGRCSLTGTCYAELRSVMRHSS